MNIAQRIWYRIGRRGATLIFLGVLDVLFGYSFLVSPRISVTKINYLLPYTTWGWIWLTAGIVCFVFAPARVDRGAFAIAALVKSAWGLVNGYIWLTTHVPRLWISAVIWLAFAGLILIISSWSESPEIHLARKHLLKKSGELKWTPAL